MDALKFYRYDHCINCDSKRAIEAFNTFNKPVQFSMLLDNIANLNKILDNVTLSHMKCRKCGKEYRIIWDENKIPRPLYVENKIDLFLNKYYIK